MKSFSLRHATVNRQLNRLACNRQLPIPKDHTCYLFTGTRIRNLSRLGCQDHKQFDAFVACPSVRRPWLPVPEEMIHDRTLPG
jgi:hypothetical protein